MTYILENLLSIRTHRENKALNHMMNSKAALQHAEDLKRRRIQELCEYRRWRRLEEKRLFDELKHQPASVQDMLCFNDIVNSLRSDQALKMQAVDDSAQQVVKAENELESARKHYASAYRNKQKIEEHKRIWMEDYRLWIEKEAEKEMEECGSTTGNRKGGQ
jgi:Type III secretion protein YscO